MRAGWVLGALLAVAPAVSSAQTVANLTALTGLAPATRLGGSEAGRQALAANLAVTAKVQNGTEGQVLLLPFAAQQQQALRDAFITGWNAAGLADGLGTRLGAAYQAVAQYANERSYTSAAPSVAALIAYTNATTASDSNAGKYAFANGTRDGTAALSAPAQAVLAKAGGVPDVFGAAYGMKAGSAGADPYGNSRPFQVLPGILVFDGTDYFGRATDNVAFLRGPESDLRDSPSFPSGHTTYGTVESVLLGILVPERYTQMVARGAEYGNDRVVLGAHYAMDVIAGRTLALHDLAHMLANDPAYVGIARGRVPAIGDYRAALETARRDVRAVLATQCGVPVPDCAAQDDGRFHDGAANSRMMVGLLTYGLPSVHADRVEDVGQLAPEAGNLLVAAFPYLSLEQANRILTETEGPGGGFLDDGSAFGVYSRLDLVAAGARAAAMAPR